MFALGPDELCSETAWTVFRAATTLRFVDFERDRIFFAAIALIVATTMIDMLPDSSLTPLTWLFAGALLGRAEDLQRSACRVQKRLTVGGGAQGASLPGSADSTRLRVLQRYQRRPTYIIELHGFFV
jgi:hypothetical protein